MNSIQSSMFLLHVILVFSLGLKPSCHGPVIKAYLPTDNLALLVLALVMETNLYLISAIEYMLVAMELGFPFPKLLHNFCRTKRKLFLSLREKTTICAIIRKSHFAQNCPIPLLRNSSFAQFRNKSFAQIRNFVKIKRLVTVRVCFLEFNSGKILFWNVFLLVTFT